MTTHTLYRFFGAADELLYVGITNNPARRFSKHRDEKEWWLGVTRIEIQHFESREALAVAEREAIKTEKPIHNIRMNGATSSRSIASDTTRRLPKGLKIGSVYAIGMEDGSCPVGLIIDGDVDGVVITKMSWLTGVFSLPDEWLNADDIVRWIKGEPFEKDHPEARMQRILYENAKATVIDCEPLGKFQTAWLEHHELLQSLNAGSET